MMSRDGSERIGVRRLRACKIAIGDSDLSKVRFAPLCGLKSDILGGPKSANKRPMHRNK